jgi:pimeloyl-ACP methyl ester carboxylesterase
MQDNRVTAEHTSRAVQVTPRPITTAAADGVPLAGVHLAAEGSGRRTALAVTHAFTHHVRHPITRGVLAALAAEAPVVALDMRGHGRSGGRNTVGDREALDVDAAVAAARGLGYEHVVTIGFSLGAAVTLRQAAIGDNRPDAVVAVSSPARWYSRETAPMRRVHWLLEQPHGRLAARMIGVRLDGAWEVVPPSPVEVVAGIDVPLLIVGFAGDPYFTPSHARALLAAAGGRAQLWEEPGDGHGESGTHPALARRIARWAVATASGPVPSCGGGAQGARNERPSTGGAGRHPEGPRARRSEAKAIRRCPR